jgi:T5SS/PEP-CTERM-associated repeat protein
VVVDGAGSSMQVTNGVVASTWGHTGHTAHVTIRNGATASLGHVDLAFGGFPGTSGTLNIQSGAVTTMGNLNVATNVLPTTTGTINIDGAGSRLTQNGASTLILGHASAGSAILNIRNGGRFDTGTGAVNILATGRVLLNGTSAPGTFHAKGPMTVRGTLQLGEAPSDAGGVLDVDAGLTIDGGTVSFRNGLVDANAITLANGGVFDFDDGMLHVDSFNGNLVNEAGTLAPGHSVGATAISGNYTQQSAATLQLEIGGIFPGQWDTVAVEGNASVDGVIDVALIGGFQPVLGNSFTVLTTNVGNVGGQFDAEVFPIFNGLTFDVVYNPKSVALQVVAASGLPGDYNEDGTVNAADYVVWRKSDGTQEGYNLWRANFGRTGGAGAVAHGIVPEPASAFFLVLATACMFLARPRHK